MPVKNTLIAGMAAATVATLAGGGYVAAAATSSTTTVIKACAARQGGGLRVASRCKAGERALRWNVQGPRGRRGPQGLPATKLFASIDAGGAVVSGTSGVHAEGVSGFPGVYQINFGRDISHCTAVANAGEVPIYSSPGAGTGRAVAFALVDQSSAGDNSDPSYPTGDTVVIEIMNTSGNLVQSAFHVAVFC